MKLSQKFSKPLNAFLSKTINVLIRFDLSEPVLKKTHQTLTPIFIITISAIGIFYLNRVYLGAWGKEFWLDENFSLEVAIRSNSHLAILLKGAQEQASPLPLDYLVIKTLDLYKPYLNFLKLPDNVYYRINAFGSFLIAGMSLGFILWSRIARGRSNVMILFLQAIAIIGAQVTLLFGSFNFFFACEMRPYALWNSLWILICCLYMIHGRSTGGILILLILIAMTASGSVFQFASLALAIIVVDWLQHRGIKSAIWESAKNLALPAFIVAYYLFGKNIHYDYPNYNDYLQEFFRFWLNKEMIPILSAAGILITIGFTPLRGAAVIFTTMMVLYLVSPFINYIVLSHKIFFSSRYYAYYDLIYPIMCIHMSLHLPFYYEKLRSQYLKVNS